MLPTTTGNPIYANMSISDIKRLKELEEDKVPFRVESKTEKDVCGT